MIRIMIVSKSNFMITTATSAIVVTAIAVYIRKYMHSIQKSAEYHRDQKNRANDELQILLKKNQFLDAENIRLFQENRMLHEQQAEA